MSSIPLLASDSTGIPPPAIQPHVADSSTASPLAAAESSVATSCDDGAALPAAKSLALRIDEPEPTVIAAARATTPGNDKLPAAAADTSGDPPASRPHVMSALLSPPANRESRLEDRDDASPSLDREDEQETSM